MNACNSLSNCTVGVYRVKKKKAEFWMSFGKVFCLCWGSVGPTAKQLFWQCFAKTFFVLITFRKVCFGRVLPEFCNSECPYYLQVFHNGIKAKLETIMIMHAGPGTGLHR